MDKRFFLALFLSLIAIAVSQLLFPAAKPGPSSRRNANAPDSTASGRAVSPSSTSPGGLPSAVPAATNTVTTSNKTRLAAAVRATPAETTTGTTQKAIYRVSSLGAEPVSIVVRDYKNRSTAGGGVRPRGGPTPRAPPPLPPQQPPPLFAR